MKRVWVSRTWTGQARLARGYTMFERLARLLWSSHPHQLLHQRITGLPLDSTQLRHLLYCCNARIAQTEAIMTSTIGIPIKLLNEATVRDAPLCFALLRLQNSIADAVFARRATSLRLRSLLGRFTAENSSKVSNSFRSYHHVDLCSPFFIFLDPSEIRADRALIYS